MKNLWPSDLIKTNTKSAKSILEEQAKILPSLTGDLINATVIQMELIDTLTQKMQGEFCYKFSIQGKLLQKYLFIPFRVSHDIGLYPVNIYIEEGLASELSVRPNKNQKFLIIANDDSEFEMTLSKIFSSNRMKMVLSSIIQLSS